MNNLSKEFLRFGLELNEGVRFGRFLKNRKTPIYFNHIRKTAGTSLISEVIQQLGMNPDLVLNEVYDKKTHRYLGGDGVVVGYNQRLLNHAAYDFGFSHLPLWSFKFTKKPFVFSVLREPVARLVSHFRMLAGMLERNESHVCLKDEGDWAKDGFDSFLEQVPRSHAEAQLFNFSESYSVDEAVKSANELNCLLFLESLPEDIERLSVKLGFEMSLRTRNKSSTQAEISEASLDRAREMLTDEIKFYNIMKESFEKTF